MATTLDKRTTQPDNPRDRKFGRRDRFAVPRARARLVIDPRLISNYRDTVSSLIGWTFISRARPVIIRGR